MTWALTYDSEMEVLRVTVSGVMTAEGLKAMTAALLEESRQRDIYRILCDCSEAGLDMDLSEVYRLPQELRELGLMSYHMVALVHSSGSAATTMFGLFDDRCHNTGLSVKTFLDFDLGRLWLTGIDWSIVSNPTALEV